jgi:L-glyceraldehyde 3-phosphate reductase
VRINQLRGWPPILINQVYYNMLSRGIEADLMGVADRFGVGLICFCPLAQGQLSDKYLGGIPKGSRASTRTGYLRPQDIDDGTLVKVGKLNEHAKERGQTLAQMALAWVVRDPRVTSALIGASRPEQIKENIAGLAGAAFSEAELKKIDAILAG